MVSIMKKSERMKHSAMVDNKNRNSFNIRKPNYFFVKWEAANHPKQNNQSA